MSQANFRRHRDAELFHYSPKRIHRPGHKECDWPRPFERARERRSQRLARHADSSIVCGKAEIRAESWRPSSFHIILSGPLSVLRRSSETVHLGCLNGADLGKEPCVVRAHKYVFGVGIVLLRGVGADSRTADWPLSIRSFMYW